MADVMQGLWIGLRLSRMEQLCIRSYLRHAHPFHLYTYESVANLPAGVTIKDANEIAPSKHIARFQNLANFSDFFRYTLLLKKGGWWVDLDAYALRPFDFPQPYVLSKQLERDGVTEAVNAGVIKAPAGSELMRRCVQRISKMDVRTTEWAALGPILLRSVHHELRLEKYAQAARVFCPLSYFEAPANINGPDTARTFGEETRSIHLWSEEWRRAGADKDASYPGSLYEQLSQ
jgi:mannosyltransferase OCH1-like enzyme